MKSDIEQLFCYLSAGDIDTFKNSFSKDLVNTFYVDTLYNYDYSYYAGPRVKKKERQHRLLIFEAMLKESCEAFSFLLDHGADLLLQETFETFDYVSEGLNAKPKVSKTNIAIICISNSENPKFIQMTFDHICEKALYEKPIFIDFMVRHLKEVNRGKFNPKFLKIDAGSPLPYCFETIEEYKDFLIKSDIDIAGLFFTKADYLTFLTDPSNQIDENFLNHALKVCNFTLEELEIIYEAVHSEHLKRILEDWDPAVNPEFVAALDLICEEEEKKKSPTKRARSESPELPKPSETAIQITSVDRQAYEHLMKRISLLEKKEQGLREKLDTRKKRKKDQDDLDSVIRSLKDCRSRFYSNPCYLLENEAQKGDLPKEPSLSY